MASRGSWMLIVSLAALIPLMFWGCCGPPHRMPERLPLSAMELLQPTAIPEGGTALLPARTPALNAACRDPQMREWLAALCRDLVKLDAYRHALEATVDAT